MAVGVSALLPTAAYVEPESALDRCAGAETAVYLPDRVIPMLPERLIMKMQTNPGRSAHHSVFIHFDRNGTAKSARFARSVIRSAHRLSYKQAYAILKSPPRDQLSERLHVAWELASLLRQNRFEHGSLDLDFPEVKVWLDETGKPVRLERVENDESHQLIENLLAANEAVAEN
jgi:ribonuclease R